MYGLKVWLLKRRVFNLAWRRVRARFMHDVGAYERLPDLVRRHAPGQTFADIGCMWGVNGRFAFLAEASGATGVKAVDVFGPTPEFQNDHAARNSSVEFILGDITDQAVIERVGEVDVVLCAGVLYHHPSPFDLIVALRAICRQTLILRTATIPEHRSLRNAAVFYPMLPRRHRRRWNLSSLGVGHQAGITAPFQPGDGYGNWFWGLTPSCVGSLLETAGFKVDQRQTEAFAQTFICSTAASPLVHKLPSIKQAGGREHSVPESGQGPWS